MFSSDCNRGVELPALLRATELDREHRRAHEALAARHELINHELEKLLARAQQDGENIRALARIAERRLTKLEGNSY